MENINELLNDTKKLDILSYEKYKKSNIKEKILKIKLLNEYYKLLYENSKKINVNFDFDGVIKDTMRHSSYLLLRFHGIDINTHDKSNEKEEKIVEEFFKSMDWEYLLNVTPEINESIRFINLFMDSNIFNPSIYSAVNSTMEKYKKINFIDKNIGNISKQFNAVHTPKIAKSFDDVLVDDTEYNLDNWQGIPIHFNNGKDSKYYTINDFGEIYYLVDFDKSNNISLNLKRILPKK